MRRDSAPVPAHSCDRTELRARSGGRPSYRSDSGLDSGCDRRSVASWLRSERLRVYTTDDVVGAEIGGAVKNVLAIAAGISDGLGFGANARAALITRGLAELLRLGLALGARAETLMGLAGVGDLVLTCTDNMSRNRRVGLALARGRSLGDIVGELGQAVEGVASAREVYALARDREIDMPITEQVYQVLFGGRSPEAAVAALLSRDPKIEGAAPMASSSASL